MIKVKRKWSYATARSAFVVRMCRELINARTPMEMKSALNDVNQDQEAVSGARPVEVDAASGIFSSGQTSFMLSPWSSSRSRSSSSEPP